MTRLMANHGATMASAVIKAACEINGVEQDQRPLIVGRFTTSTVGLTLELLDGYAHVGDDVARDWQGAVNNDDAGFERTIQAINPRFITELRMLGTEYKVKQLGEFINHVAEGEWVSDLGFFVGKPLIEQAIDPYYRPADTDDSLGEVEREVMHYERHARSGYWPIDPEHLVGTVATAMSIMNLA